VHAVSDGELPQFVPRSQLVQPLTWVYRCYLLSPAKAGWRARSLLKHLTLGLPRSFDWAEREDKDGLRGYIDAVTAGRTAAVMEFESRGLVTNVEHDPEVLTDSIKVNLKAFLSVLSQRDWLDMPLRATYNFTTDGKKLVPAQFIAVLAEYAGNPAWFGNPDDWRWATPQDLERISGGDPNGVHTGMYRGKENFMDAAPGAGPAPIDADGDPVLVDAPPVEIEINRRSFAKHFELLTQVKPPSGQPYFVRRLALYNGRILWAGSSFSPVGKWTVYERDTSLLLAYGLTP
jgi:hypothetical protein